MQWATTGRGWVCGTPDIGTGSDVALAQIAAQAAGIDVRRIRVVSGDSTKTDDSGPTAMQAAEPIRIGEINSYTALADFTQPYKKGWQMAVEEINAAGGVLGRPLEVIARDDNGKPGNAVTIAEELSTKENVDMLAGTFFSHIGVAVTNYSKQRNKLFLATEPMSDDITWAQGHEHTFRLRPSTYIQSAMLAEEAAKLPAKRWAVVAPNYKFGQDAVAAFKKVMQAKRPRRRVRGGAVAGAVQDRPRWAPG